MTDGEVVIYEGIYKDKQCLCVSVRMTDGEVVIYEGIYKDKAPVRREERWGEKTTQHDRESYINL